MSGCLFTNRSHVLAGLQKTGLSGLGGKMRFTELAIETAWRETMEELFGFHQNFIKDRMYELCAIRPLRVLVDDAYVCFVYTFKDLEKALSILKKYHPISPLYRYFPTTVSDLVLNRREFSGGPEGEVGTLALLPASSELSLDPVFLDDLARLIRPDVRSIPSGYYSRPEYGHPPAACRQRSDAADRGEYPPCPES